MTKKVRAAYLYYLSKQESHRVNEWYWVKHSYGIYMTDNPFNSMFANSK